MEHTDEEAKLLGIDKSCGFGSFGQQNFNCQPVTPFHFEGMHGGLGSSGPTSLIGNTRRTSRREGLSIVLGPHGICRVCEHVVSGVRYRQCTLCNRVVHPDCCTQFGIVVAVCHRCMGDRIDKLNLTSEPRPQIESPRILVDRRFAVRKSLELFLGSQPPLWSRPWLGWDALQSEECRVLCKDMMVMVRGVSSVMQRCDGDDEGHQQREVEDDSGALQD